MASKHEEIVNILTHEGNPNQNDTEIPFHSSQNFYQENKQQEMLMRVLREGRRRLFYTVGENVK
jgi:hypothetical protein